jgi:hypothetical protein
MSRKMWVVRPEPNFVDRLENFLSEGMVAIGWPKVGDISGGLLREDMAKRLCGAYEHYRDENKNDLSVAAGILERFANQLQPDDYVMVPRDDDVFVGEVTGEYFFRPELMGEGPDQGYPHWHKVSYLTGKEPFCRIRELPLGVRRAIDCNLTVFSINKGAQPMMDFIASRTQAQKPKAQGNEHPHEHPHEGTHEHPLAHSHEHKHEHSHERPHEPGHPVSHEHPHSNPSEHPHDKAHSHEKAHSPDNTHSHSHEHAHEHAHDHSHDKAHDHSHDKAHDKAHDHKHEHGHSQADESTQDQEQDQGHPRNPHPRA